MARIGSRAVRRSSRLGMDLPGTPAYRRQLLCWQVRWFACYSPSCSGCCGEHWLQTFVAGSVLCRTDVGPQWSGRVMPVWLSAGLWGVLGASSLVAGAAVAYLATLPRWLVAGIMSFGCGVLISAVAYDLLEDGYEEGGLLPIIGGAIVGSAAYAVADWLVSR